MNLSPKTWSPWMWVDATTGGYYRVVTTNKSWLDAQADCKDDVANATHLIVLSSAAENTFMRTKLGWVGLSAPNFLGSETGHALPPYLRLPLFPNA